MAIPHTDDLGAYSDRPIQVRAKWSRIWLFAVGLGFVTFAYVMMSHDVEAAIVMLRQWLEEGSITPVLARHWVGGDLGNVLTGTLFFSFLWLAPVAMIRFAATATRAFWCLAGITALASVLVLVIAVLAFLTLYLNVEDTSNAVTWPSVRSGFFAMVVMAPALVAWGRARRQLTSGTP